MSHVVYILLSINHPNKYYVGYTSNLRDRLMHHNSKSAGYTKRYAPWKVETYTTFKDEEVARKFERYFKEGSGQAFLVNRLLPKSV